LLVSMAVVMAALILTVALPALAAPPTLTVTCLTPPTGVAISTNDPQEYDELNAFYRECEESGGTATRDHAQPWPPHPVRAQVSPEVLG
jgi:hypothetical protein